MCLTCACVCAEGDARALAQHRDKALGAMTPPQAQHFNKVFNGLPAYSIVAAAYMEVEAKYMLLKKVRA